MENDRLISVGHGIETDESLRRRILALKYEGSGFLVSMKSALAKVDGVKDVCIIENNYPDVAFVNGVRLIGHSVYICLYLGDVGVSESIKTNIGNAIANTISLGCGTKSTDSELTEMGALCYEATPSVPSAGNLYFFTPVKLQLAVNITVIAPIYAGTSLVSDIQKAASEYVESISIGETIYSTEFARAISVAVPSAFVKKIELFVADDPTAVSQTSIGSYSFQKAVLSRDNVLVTVE